MGPKRRPRRPQVARPLETSRTRIGVGIDSCVLLTLTTAAAAPWFCTPTARRGREDVRVDGAPPEAELAGALAAQPANELACRVLHQGQEVLIRGESWRFHTLEGPGPAAPTQPEEPQLSLKGFDAREAEVVGRAWSLLNPQERSVVAGSRAERRRARKKLLSGRVAETKVTGGVGKVVFWAGAFEWDHLPYRQGGQPRSLYYAVHELGHVVEGAAFIEISREGPASCLFEAIADLNGSRALLRISSEPLTPYCADDSGECFADAFALWKLEPAWLQQGHPEVYDWFETGKHLDWRAEASQACGGPGAPDDPRPRRAP